MISVLFLIENKTKTANPILGILALYFFFYIKEFSPSIKSTISPRDQKVNATTNNHTNLDTCCPFEILIEIQETFTIRHTIIFTANAETIDVISETFNTTD